ASEVRVLGSIAKHRWRNPNPAEITPPVCRPHAPKRRSSPLRSRKRFGGTKRTKRPPCPRHRQATLDPKINFAPHNSFPRLKGSHTRCAVNRSKGPERYRTAKFVKWELTLNP